MTAEEQHADMVSCLIKDGETIRQELTPMDCRLIHAVMGVAGEAGELLDAIKKHTMYRKPLDLPNVIEELGDLEFFMQDIREVLGITRDQTLEANIDKLPVRYPGMKYSDQRAQFRADKK